MNNNQDISPIDMSREMVEHITKNEYIRMKLHTCICHELTAEQIKELYLELKQNINNGNQLCFDF